MRTSLGDLLATHDVLLADGATGTNYFQRGLTSGHPPELWNVEHPEHVQGLHREFVEAGADIILTNSFGGTAQRLKLHHAQDRVHELNALAARLAREVADAAERPVVVAGSVGPTGELFEPLGALTHDVAVASFREQIEGLKDGGADVIWIETMSAAEEIRAAAQAAIDAGMPYTATCSFDTAGRTMMGLMPDALVRVFDGLAEAPLAFGANCGVGASDILVSVLSMCSGEHTAVISKGNCGIPQFQGTEVVYSGTPELMGTYAEMAADAGARIVGGCCGTSPAHLASMRRALDGRTPGETPTVDDIVTRIGPLTNAAPSAGGGDERARRRSRRSAD
ncbi:MAG: betaine--homocysteine S-methyltransferase [Acidimicrobiales bacterium]|nr:betaine--homocysteine S-methyltransferase [Acidimicrobiales bacterium]MCB9394144.1 betaine--homocysteine S-methyltransferase [Acidimicrobiaceae bacterium]